MKEKRKGPLSRAAGLAEGMAAAIRRIQRDATTRSRLRPRRLLAPDPAGGARARPDHGGGGEHASSCRPRVTLVDPELAERVLERALARGGDMAELYAESRRGFAISLDDGRVERPQGGRESGGACRDQGELDLLRPCGRAGRGGPCPGGRFCFGGGAGRRDAPDRPPSGRRHAPRGPDAAGGGRGPPQGRGCRLRRACRAAGAEVTQARIGYAENHRQVEVYGSDGRAAADDRTRIRLSAQVVARRNGRVETGTDTRGGHVGWELLEERPEEVAEHAARRALTLLDAVDAPTGRLPVVVGNGFGGVLLHEAVGHGLEADAVQKDASVYAGRWASRSRRVRDCLRRRQPPGRLGQRRHRRRGHAHAPDDRDRGAAGSAPTCTTCCARAQGRRGSTGNGRRESFRHLPIPRMTNTFFAPGDATPEELIGGVARGCTRSRSAADRWSPPPATSSSASPRAT